MLHHLRFLGILVVCFVLSQVSIAQARPDTWVSGSGADTGTCVITAPCRTFAYAHSQTNNNGSINVLSSGHFGPLTITKSISIVAQGVEAAIISGAGGAGIIVQAGAGIVSLRGLTIDLRGGANHGISFVSGGALHVHDCVIRGVDNGIEFTPASGFIELSVSNSVIANYGDTGINIFPTGTARVKARLDRVQMENAQFHGLGVRGDSTTAAVTVVVRDSVMDGGAGTGISVVENGVGTTTVMIERSTIMHYVHGIASSGAGATVRIGDSTVTANGSFGFFNGSGAIVSYETNRVNGNGNDGAATSTVAHK